jgi:signal-transduction protein with cAMP-binding, CBS, and nucleotidyltransferase domain
MTLISDRTGILRTQETKTFIDRFHKSVRNRITVLEGSESLKLLHALKENLVAEASAVNRSVTDIENLMNRLEEAAGVDDIGFIAENFHQLAAEQFRNRASVRTFQAHYSRFFDLLIRLAVTSAADMLKNEGIFIDSDRFCLLVSGDLGRQETTRRFSGRIILLAEDFTAFSRENFNLLMYRMLAILETQLAQGEKKSRTGGKQHWSGSLTEWREFVISGLSGGKNPVSPDDGIGDAVLFADMVELIADLRPLCGSLPLAEEALTDGRKRLAAELPGERFWPFARQTASMTVAIGIFGKFKTIRTGKYRGTFSLEEMAINPFIASIRILAISYGIADTSTISRIKGILATGNLGVTLADRLLIAYYDFMKELIEHELSDPVSNEKVYLDPDRFDESTSARFRSGLEDITTLQRLVYQHLVEVD